MTSHITCRDQVRASVRRNWAEILEVAESDITDSSHFFADGGDSLLAVVLAMAIGDEFSSDVPVDLVFIDARFGAFCEAAVNAVSDAGTAR